MKHKGIKNLTYTQRLQIETLINAKIKVKDIAKQLGLHISTVYYELKRGEYQHLKKTNDFWRGTKIKYITKYSAQIAQQRYEINCTAKGRPLKLGDDYEFVHYIEDRVHNEKISPIAVLGQIKHKNIYFKTDISRTTLYRYIDMGIFAGIRITKRKSKYKKVKVAKRCPRGTSIEKRPSEINARKTFGHWEMDCVCGPTNATILVLSERLTRKEILFKMENQTSNSVINCLNTLENNYGQIMFSKIFKSITMDNGSEFANFAGIEKSIFGGKRTETYYCHPYHSAERGTNERLNREIRRLIPKSTSLTKYTQSDIQVVEDWLNNYPRSILDYATANELFEEQLKLLT